MASAGIGLSKFSGGKSVYVKDITTRYFEDVSESYSNIADIVQKAVAVTERFQSIPMGSRAHATLWHSAYNSRK